MGHAPCPNGRHERGVESLWFSKLDATCQACPPNVRTLPHLMRHLPRYQYVTSRMLLSSAMECHIGHPVEDRTCFFLAENTGCDVGFC
jgi:hypothetical protein